MKDDSKIIDITDYTSSKEKDIEYDFSTAHEMYKRSQKRRSAQIKRMKNENYLFAMINLLLITQSILIIGFIFILSKLY